jgi:hypothetical protein
MRKFTFVSALVGLLVMAGCATQSTRTDPNGVSETHSRTDALASKVVQEQTDVLGFSVKTPGNSAWFAFTAQLGYARNNYLSLPTSTNVLYTPPFVNTGNGNISLINQAATVSEATAPGLLPPAAFNQVKVSNVTPITNSSTNSVATK